MNATVIIPAYNPEENLNNIVNRIWELGNQVIVVDDGSDKSKKDIFCQLSETAIVLHHEKNKGKGAAIKTALRYIKENLWDCNVVGVMDADGQHLPDDMERLLMKAINKKKIMVLGVRNIGKDMPLKSRIGNLYFIPGQIQRPLCNICCWQFVFLQSTAYFYRHIRCYFIFLYLERKS